MLTKPVLVTMLGVAIGVSVEAGTLVEVLVVCGTGGVGGVVEGCPVMSVDAPHRCPSDKQVLRNILWFKILETCPVWVLRQLCLSQLVLLATLTLSSGGRVQVPSHPVRGTCPPLPPAGLDHIREVRKTTLLTCSLETAAEVPIHTLSSQSQALALSLPPCLPPALSLWALCIQNSKKTQN